MAETTTAPTPAPAPAAGGVATTTGGGTGSQGAAQATAPAPAPVMPDLNNPFAQLDALALEGDKPKAKVETKAAPKVEAKVEAKTESKVETKAEGEPKPDAEPKFTNAKELRSAYERVQKENQTLKSELEKRKSEKVEDPEKKTLLEKLEQIEKHKAEIETELKYASYEKSQEYKEKYQKPMETAFQTAYDEIKTLQIEDAEGNATPATNEHFNSLLNMDLANASKKAKEWFGDAAPEVMANRRRILELNRVRLEAVKEFQAKAGERDKERLLEETRNREKINELWTRTNKEQVEKFPQFFAPEEGDEQGNQLLEAGYKVTDLAFSDMKDIPAETRVALHATVRNKAAAFDRLASKYSSATKKIAELEEQLSAYTKSEPTEDTDSGEKGAVPGVNSWEAELDKLATASR